MAIEWKPIESYGKEAYSLLLDGSQVAAIGREVVGDGCWHAYYFGREFLNEKLSEDGEPLSENELEDMKRIVEDKLIFDLKKEAFHANRAYESLLKEVRERRSKAGPREVSYPIVEDAGLPIVEWKWEESKDLNRHMLFFEGRMIAAIENHDISTGDWYACSYSEVSLNGIWDSWVAPWNVSPNTMEKLKTLVEEKALGYYSEHDEERANRFAKGLEVLRQGSTITIPKTFHDRLLLSLEACLSSYDLDGVELTEEYAKRLEKLLKEDHKSMKNAIGIVLSGIKETLESGIENEEHDL